MVVPSILLSQAAGGFIASVRHHKLKNAHLGFKSEDFRIASIIVGLGILAVVFGVFIGTNVPKLWLKTYIGLLCIIMGAIVLRNKVVKLSPEEMAKKLLEQLILLKPLFVFWLLFAGF